MKKIIIYIFLILSEVCIAGNFIEGTDSTAKFRIHSWTLSENYGDLLNVKIDTTSDLFQIYNPAYKNRISIAFLGNVGQASISNNFFQNNLSSFLFLSNFEPYIYNSSNTQYYNTRKHFTNFSYFSSLFNKKKYEQVVNVIHTQNINKNFNAGFRFNVISSVGQYIYQQTRNYSVNGFSSYIIDRYSAHLSLNFNKIKLNENGGITSDADVTDSLLKPDNILVNMESAKSTFTNRNIQLVQKLNFGNKDSIQSNDTTKTKNYNYHNSIIYVFNYNYYKKIYSDDNPDFYRNIYFDSTETLDSTGLRIISNSIQLRKDEKNILNTGAYVQFSNDIKKYHSYNSTNILNYNFLSAGLFNNINKYWTWNLSGKYYIDGYYKEDYTIKGEINKKFYNKKDSAENDYSCISFNAKVYSQTPDYFENIYFSNHFSWINDFDKITGYNLQLNYSYPKYNFNIGINYSNIEKYIYYDTSAVPVQNNSDLTVLMPYLNKNFRLGNWHFINTAFYQNINNKQVLRMPELAFYHSTYCEFNLFKKVLLTQIGIDVYYNTQYYGYCYMPATSVFYVQDNKKIGNYPYFNFYLNFKLKTCLIFLKVEHFNQKLIKSKYFTVEKYPMNPVTFKFGLSWNFYD